MEARRKGIIHVSELLLRAKIKLYKIIKILSIVSLSWQIKNKVWEKKCLLCTLKFVISNKRKVQLGVHSENMFIVSLLA